MRSTRLRELNERYAQGGPDIFYLFHRRRLWNESQGCWMGWERKRGKLLEFNRLLRGARDTSYVVMTANPADLPRFRYVITLDADTQMPRDAVRRLVGAAAHPLNRPRYNAGQGRVVAGYGVLQPRISFHLAAATRSRFAALLAASGGIDPYSTATSDVFMDLFGVGSFTGKGIYDIDAFEAATGETFPENQILSHDLIEGNYARCALLNDTELFDDFPARYHAYARREQRWVRGDWQLLPWLGHNVPTGRGRRSNPLPLLERWKLLDNMRRSLVPPAFVLLLTLGWTVLPGSPWLWTAAALALMSVALIQAVLTGTLSFRAGEVACGHEDHAEQRCGRHRRDRARNHVSGLSRSDALNRHRADPSAALDHATAVAGVGNGPCDRPALEGWARGLLCEDVGGPGTRARDRALCPGAARKCTASGGRIPGCLAGLTGGGLLGQQAQPADRHTALRVRASRTAPAGAEDVAFLRDLRRRYRPLAAAGQFPVGPGWAHRPSYVADQFRPAPVIDTRGSRPRLYQLACAGRSAGTDARYVRPPGDALGSLLQLV